MSLWLCERGHTTPGSDGAPVCWTCGSLNVHRVEMVPIEDASLFALREERDAARRAHLACQEAWEQQRSELTMAETELAQLREIRAELLAELECERLDSHGLMERCKGLEAERDRLLVRAEGTEAARDQADADVADLIVKRDIWRHTAYEKIRTRRTICERVAAGEAVADVAADYDVPAEWVAAISAPGYDFSSDPEAEIETLWALVREGVDVLDAYEYPHAIPQHTKAWMQAARVVLQNEFYQAGRPENDAGSAMEAPTAVRGLSELQAEIEALKADLALNAKLLARQCDLSRQAEHDAVVARAENVRLREQIADYEADHRAICGDECAPDELHCSCVPHLRDEIKRLAGVSARVRCDGDHAEPRCADPECWRTPAYWRNYSRELNGLSTRSPRGPSVPGLPSDAGPAQTVPTPASTDEVAQ